MDRSPPPDHRHLYPKHASWLDMAELWFSVLTRGLLRRGEFTSRADLIDKITRFTIRYNQTARPWTWTYDTTTTTPGTAPAIAPRLRLPPPNRPPARPCRGPPDSSDRIQATPSRISAALH